MTTQKQNNKNIQLEDENKMTFNTVRKKNDQIEVFFNEQSLIRGIVDYCTKQGPDESGISYKWTREELLNQVSDFRKLMFKMALASPKDFMKLCKMIKLNDPEFTPYVNKILEDIIRRFTL